MSPTSSLIIAALYSISAATILIHEYIVIKRGNGDSSTVVLALVLINLLMPGFAIYSLLGILGTELRTGNYFFDKVLSQLNFFDSLTAYLLINLFVLGFFIAVGFSRAKSTSTAIGSELRIRGSLATVCAATLFVICGTFFWGLGKDFFERYANLILFRNLDPSIERTAFSANAFAATQTLTWLSAGLTFIYLSEKKYFKAIVYFSLMLFAAFMMGSRRGIIFPFVILYFCAVLMNRQIYVSKLLIFIPIFVLLISFGKELTGSIASNVEIGLSNQYESVGSMMLRAFSDIGISLVESLAVLQNFDSYTPRLGVDHLLSVLRRIPDGMLGLEIDWPDRIVRITTEAFTFREDADIPPGLIGQSWLDLPIIGALIWGGVIGIQCRLLNDWTSGTPKSPAKTVLIVLLSLVIALPLNSGSFDFTFSVDIFLLLFLLMMLFRRYQIE